jgi:hypothetical protein
MVTTHWRLLGTASIYYVPNKRNGQMGRNKQSIILPVQNGPHERASVGDVCRIRPEWARPTDRVERLRDSCV